MAIGTHCEDHKNQKEEEVGGKRTGRPWSLNK